VEKISYALRQGLHHATVSIVDTHDGKPGSADRHIALALDRFERTHKPPATIVLVSGDIDFVQKLSDLRHRARYNIILVHNGQAKKELRDTANRCHDWRSFIKTRSDSTKQKEPKNSKRPQSANQASPAAPPSGSKAKSITPKSPAPASPEYACLVCASSFSGRPSLNQHKTSKRHWQCRQCKMLFASKEHLFDHEEQLDHLIFECATCSHAFKSAHALGQHEDSKGHWTCAICKRCFKDGTALYQHREDTDHYDESDEGGSEDSDDDE
jgi:stress-induced morphogen